MADQQSVELVTDIPPHLQHVLVEVVKSSTAMLEREIKHMRARIGDQSKGPTR